MHSRRQFEGRYKRTNTVCHHLISVWQRPYILSVTVGSERDGKQPDTSLGNPLILLSPTPFEDDIAQFFVL